MNIFRAKVASTGLKSDVQHAQVSVILSSCILRINVYQRKRNTNWMLMKTFWSTYRVPWHPVWKSWMESSPFISRWKRGPDRKRGLARATQSTRGLVHTRKSLDITYSTSKGLIWPDVESWRRDLLGAHESLRNPVSRQPLRQAQVALGGRQPPLDEDAAPLPPGLPGEPWPRHPHL